MAKLIERNLLETQVLYVNESDRSHPYRLVYTPAGLPFYVPPDGKNEIDPDIKIDESLFLPITPAEFTGDDNEYFFGFRFLFSAVAFTTITWLNDHQPGVSDLQLGYQICRIRYFPSGEKTIDIDKCFDPIFPPQHMGIKAMALEIPSRVHQCMMEIMDLYCSYYVDKRV